MTISLDDGKQHSSSELCTKGQFEKKNMKKQSANPFEPPNQRKNGATKTKFWHPFFTWFLVLLSFLIPAIATLVDLYCSRFGRVDLSPRMELLTNILVYCTFFVAIAACVAAWLFKQSGTLKTVSTCWLSLLITMHFLGNLLAQ